MPDKPASNYRLPSEEPRFSRLAANFPFDRDFFHDVFPDRLRSLCRDPQDLPVVWIHLADGSVLDLCHFEKLERNWMAVSAFKDADAGNELFTVFLPYTLIDKITLTRQRSSRRQMGFQLGTSLKAFEP